MTHATKTDFCTKSLFKTMAIHLLVPLVAGHGAMLMPPVMHPALR